MGYNKHTVSTMGTCYIGSSFNAFGTICSEDFELPSFMDDRVFCAYCSSQLNPSNVVLNCPNCGAPKTKECYGSY